MYNYYRLLSGILSKIKPDEKLKFTILKEQSQSLLTVINSLNLINEKSRYIMIKHSDEDNEYTTNVIILQYIYIFFFFFFFFFFQIILHYLR